MRSEEDSTRDAHLSIQELPQTVRDILVRAQQPPLPETAQRWGLFVRYLRRKPERGLAVIYDACELRPHHQRASALRRTISLTIAETALHGSAIAITSTQAHTAPLATQTEGIVQAEELGLALQAFPADNSLPHLAASCDAAPSSPLFTHLQEAIHLLTESKSWRITSAQAVPVRYKPASRCVIRYDLMLQHPNGQQRSLSLFGKVYADPAQARSVHALLQRLYDEQHTHQGSSLVGYTQQTPLLPRPLLYIEQYGLTLNDAVRPLIAGETLRGGPGVLQPLVVRQRGGNIISRDIPERELRLAALALARIHTSTVDSGQLRPGTKEAKRARERAELLASYYPNQAPEIQALAHELAQRLETLTPETYRPAHGGFKASQLLYRENAVSVVDFDGFCLADSALDIGYFLAYLRPSGLWYHRQGTRAWFEAAAQAFITTYIRALSETGIALREIAAILQRAQLYTAALLFKIATRRVNRLNSPRPSELTSILAEIADCLALSTRRE